MPATEVVVVGGGPTGLALAGDLARAGRQVTVLERWPDVNPSSRAFAVQARTLELLDSRGLADPLLAKGITTDAIRLFHGATLDLSRLPSRYRGVLVTPQTNVDRALEGYARAQGATVLRGAEVTDLVQDADGVSVIARPKDGGEPTVWRAKYVVGADGAHSRVRKLVGIGFPGEAVLSSVVLADVRLDRGPTGGGLTLASTGEVFGFLAPYGDTGWFRSMTWDRRRQLPDDAPVDPAEVGDVLERALGRDVGVAEISWKSRFHCEERQAESYRAGRVFLAGDAAHVHSPMGGQGLNTGVQDAVNLAWKLALVLDGAPESIVDTYHAERHPVGKAVLARSGSMMRAITLGAGPGRTLQNLVAPRLLGIRRVSDAMAAGFAGVTLRYPRGRHEHPLVGTRATEIPLRGDRMTVLQREPGFALVRESGAPLLDTALAQAERADRGPAVLVRPDGYVAWAGSSAATGRAGWRSALAAWTGDLAVTRR